MTGNPDQVPGHASGRAALYGAAAAILVLTVFGRLPSDRLWAESLTNAAHGPAFLLLTLLLFAVLRRSSPPGASPARSWIVAPVLAILLGSLVELVQMITGRDASLGDIWHDMLGAATAVGILAAFRPGDAGRGRATRWAGLAVAVVGAALLVAPAMLTGAAYLERRQGFPLLADLGSPLGRYFLGATPNLELQGAPLPAQLAYAAEARAAVHVRLTDDAYWQLVLREPIADWRGYRHLNVELANPTGEPLVIILRLLDQREGNARKRPAFRKVVEVAPHSGRVASLSLVEADRARVDVARLQSVVIARSRANRAREFYIARIWLD